MVSVTITLNERATTDVLQVQAIQAVSDNPRVVSDASQQERTASYNRTSERVASWESLTTTS